MTGNNPAVSYSFGNFTATHTYDEAGNLLSVNGSNGSGGAAGSLGLLLRLEHLGDGYDAEGRLKKIEYNKVDFGSEFAFYDLNDDCKVDSADLGLIANAFGLGVGQQGYRPRYDLDSNGFIDASDISPVTGSMFGKYCPRLVYDAVGNLTKVEGHEGGPPPKRMVYIGGIFEKNLDTQEVTKYYFGPDGRRIAMRKGSTLYYLAQDQLGGTALVMNSSGGVVSRMGYYPFGMTWTEQPGMPTDRLYTGQQRFGAKSGMYNYASRFYSADIGRFPQPDSILPDVFEPQALSRYTYVSNNPTNYTDPTGHFGYGSYPVGPIPGGGGDPLSTPGYDNGAGGHPSPHDEPGYIAWHCEHVVHSAFPLAWRFKLSSNFYYNYQTLWQEPPEIDTSGTLPAAYYWQNLHWQVSSWSRTIQFADAWGELHTWVSDFLQLPDLPGVGIWTKDVHAWIQEDAWGNCTDHGHVGPWSFKPPNLWPF